MSVGGAVAQLGALSPGHALTWAAVDTRLGRYPSRGSLQGLVDSRPSGWRPHWEQGSRSVGGGGGARVGSSQQPLPS